MDCCFQPGYSEEEETDTRTSKSRRQGTERVQKKRTLVPSGSLSTGELPYSRAKMQKLGYLALKAMQKGDF